MLVLVSGAALLGGLGLTRLRYLGLAYVAGWAALGVLGSFAATVGASFAVWQVLVLLALVAAAGLAASRRTAPVPEPPPRQGARWPTLAFGGLTAVAVVVVLARAVVQGTTHAWDAWGFWIPKAMAIIEFGGIDTSPGGFASFAHPDYPPLVPVVHAISLRFSGADPSLLPLQDWALYAAFLGAVAGLLARRVSALALWPSLAMLALLPELDDLVGSSLADPLLAELFALAGIAAALWLREGRGAFLVLAALLLAAGALAKNEGLLLALVLCAALAVSSRRILAPAATAAAALLVLVPWRIWLAVNDIPLQPDYRLSDLGDPGYLVDRVGRLGTALAELPGYLLGPDRWLLAVPLALAAAVLAARRGPRLALFAGLVIAATFAGLAVVYWISTIPIDWYIDTSAERAVASTAVFAAALLPLLLAEALADDG